MIEGRICTVEVIIEGQRYQRRIALAQPDTGGINPLSDDNQVMVYGTALGTQEDNRWHHFPARNVVSYNTASDQKRGY